MFVQGLFAQKVTLEGNIDWVKPGDTVYCVYKGQPFSKKDFLIVNSNQKIIYNIDIAQVKRAKLNWMRFSNTPVAKFQNEDNYFCLHKFSLTKIAELVKKHPQIKNLKTDIFGCIDTAMGLDTLTHGFVGKYVLKKDDTTLKVELMKNRYFLGTMGKYDENYMDLEYGYWLYNTNTKILSLIVHQAQNAQIGLKLQKQGLRYQFKVTRQNGKMVFQSDQYTLKRLEWLDLFRAQML